MKACALRWNETHISICYKKVYGDSGNEYRKNWHRNVHQKVFRMYPCHKYIERRGRQKIETPTLSLQEKLRSKRRKTKLKCFL